MAKTTVKRLGALGETNEQEPEPTGLAAKQRVQFDFTPEALQRLDGLKNRVEASTRAEVIRNALKLYEWFVTQVNPVCVVEIEDEEGHALFRIPAQVLLS